LSSIPADAGRSVTFEHDADLNLLTRVTDPAGNSVTYEYSSNNDLTRVSGGCAGCGGGSSMSYTYTGGSEDPDLNHNLATKTDGLGNASLAVTYDAGVRVTSSVLLCRT